MNPATPGPPAGQRDRLRDDLHGVFRGDLLFGPLDCALYSTDASLFQVTPIGVATPRDEDDLRVLVRYAAEHHLPLIPRGAGTGVAGESLGPGLVVDLSRHMRGVLVVGSDSVRVQPGVVLRALNEQLAADGRRFAPDPANVHCTIGGMAATDASGARAIRHGTTRDHVARLRAIFADGETADVGREPVLLAAEGTAARVVRETAGLIETNTALIDAHRSRAPFDRCGYRLHGVLADGVLDLARLLVGSEGTLAFFAELTLRTEPLPGGRSAVLAGFASVDGAVRAALAARDAGPSACELLDRRVLSLARSQSEDVARMVPTGAEAALLVEFEAESSAGALDQARKLVDILRRTAGAALLAGPLADPADVARLWAVRDAAVPKLYGMPGGPRPVAVVEDIGVPPEELGTFLTRAQAVLRQHDVSASFLVHALAGQVHTRPLLDPDDPADAVKLWPLAEELHGLALELGGTVSTQHGVGLARTPWVARQFGPLYGVFRQLKQVFDPQGILNPGKIVGPAPDQPAWPLRNRLRSTEGTPENPADVARPLELPVVHLKWERGEVAGEAAACSGCGECRTEAVGVRMCPTFRVTRAEEATPRAKANLMRMLLQPDAGPKRAASEDVRAVAELCVNCRMCVSECPSKVNVSQLMLEAKAARLAEHGLDRAEWVLARTEGFAALGSRLAPFSNVLLRSRWARWWLEKLFGVARARRLPPFAVFNFLLRARLNGWTRRPTFGTRPGQPEVGPVPQRAALFVDVFGLYCDPQLAEACVRVLQHHGIEVVVPPGQRGSGMAPLAQGDVETAREAVQRNLRAFAEYARDGYAIICPEPTSALMLKQDAPRLVDDPDVRLLADNTVELTEFLGGLQAQGRLRTDFKPLDVRLGHHVPCHRKALGGVGASPGLLSLIPGTKVHTIDVGCSGMAGTFGLRADNYAASREMGQPVFDALRAADVTHGSTECSTCRMQLEDGAGTRTLHPVQYLALAYGLMPELNSRLHEPMGRLVTR